LKIEPVLAVTMVPFCVQEKPPVAETALAVVVTVVGGVETVAVGADVDEDVCREPKTPPTTAIAATRAMMRARRSQKARIGMPHSVLRGCFGGALAYCSCLWVECEEYGMYCCEWWLCCG
jgi:hypothetical protein